MFWLPQNLKFIVKIFLGAIFAAIFVRAETLPFKNYTTADGLGHDRVDEIVRDSRGFLWFCTGEGLSRFDGYEFKNYTQADGLPRSYARSCGRSANGVLWFTQSNALARLVSTAEEQSKNRFRWERTHPCVLDAKRSKKARPQFKLIFRQTLIRHEARRSTQGCLHSQRKTFLFFIAVFILNRPSAVKPPRFAGGFSRLNALL